MKNPARKILRRRSDSERAERWLEYKARILPDQLERAYARVRELEVETVSLGLGRYCQPPRSHKLTTPEVQQ